MRRYLFLVVLVALAAMPLHPAGASGARVDGPVCVDGEAPLFAGGGTNLTTGFFFPGTAVHDGEEFQGVPYQIEKGCNIRFVNADPAVLTNGHRIMSFKRKKRRPLFASPLVKGPDDALMITEHLKPGLYAYFCTVHAGMFGQLEVVEPGGVK